MGQVIINTIVATASKQEYNQMTRVYDVREYHPDAPVGIPVIGGFVSEMILVFTTLYELIHAVPATSDFKFTVDAMEKFIQDITLN